MEDLTVTVDFTADNPQQQREAIKEAVGKLEDKDLIELYKVHELFLHGAYKEILTRGLEDKVEITDEPQ